MTTKNPLSLKPIELTERIAKAIKCEAGDRYVIEVEADPIASGFDHVTVSAENTYLIIAVGRGVIELPLHDIPVSGKNHVKAVAYFKSLPGTSMRIPQRLEGCLEQQYDNPKTAIEAAFFLFMLDNAERMHSQVAEIMKKSVLG
jgi:hypothetical protein